MKRYIWIGMTALFLMTAMAGCGKKEETVQMETTQAETTETSEEETTQEESRPEETTQEAAERYHMLRGTVTEESQDGSRFSLLADTGVTYEISLDQIRDVEEEIEPEVQIAIAYIGEELESQEDLDQVDLVVVFPEQEEWTICQETGTTLFNAMSSFTLKTDQGHELQLLKDNCPIEDGALSQDSGDRVTVIYVTSQGLNFPIEILKAGDQNDEG